MKRAMKQLPEAAHIGVEAQPLFALEWASRDSLTANLYNPNAVAPPELHLLRISLLEDGWTQPLVALPSGELIDGFHRWTLAGEPEIAAMTDGLVPVVRLSVSLGHQMISTIRHNRARGTHGILPMATIVRRLIDEAGMTREQVMALLQMEWEEVDRLYDRAGMAQRTGKDTFNTGWVPE